MHIKNWNNKSLTQFINPKQASITEIEKYKDNDFSYIIEQNFNRNRYINECLYIDYKKRKVKLNNLRFEDLKVETNRLKKSKMIGFDKHLLEILGDTFTGEIEYVSMEEEEKQVHLESLNIYLESIIGEKLFKEEQVKLIELVGLKDERGRLQKSIGRISTYIKEISPQYSLVSKKSNGKRFWFLSKT